MNIIYEPTGKAREYSALAANLYTGCNHGCKYCYAPSIRRIKRNQYLNPKPAKNVIKRFEKDCNTIYGSTKPVLFCFMSDPYNITETNYKITRQCLKIALENKISIKILTKSKLVLRDIDLFKQFGKYISVGMTLTFKDEQKSLEWETEASTPIERIETLLQLKSNDISTWASFEPVIEPEESLAMLNETINLVDHFKIGKINNYQGLDKKINWNDFLLKIIKILRKNNKSFYIKKDLREAASNIKLNPIEYFME